MSFLSVALCPFQEEELVNTHLADNLRGRMSEAIHKSGWNPTKLPIRGYISFHGIVAWPQPNVWTQRPLRWNLP